METAAKACVAAAGVYCGVGLTVPIIPTIVALLAVIMVRILIPNRNKSIIWNITVCGLAMLAAFSTIEGDNSSVFIGFWLGVGYGAVGVGIIEIGKSAVMKALGERFSNAAAVLFGIKSQGEQSDD